MAWPSFLRRSHDGADQSAAPTDPPRPDAWRDLAPMAGVVSAQLGQRTSGGTRDFVTTLPTRWQSAATGSGLARDVVSSAGRSLTGPAARLISRAPGTAGVRSGSPRLDQPVLPVGGPAPGAGQPHPPPAGWPAAASATLASGAADPIADERPLVWTAAQGFAEGVDDGRLDPTATPALVSPDRTPVPTSRPAPVADSTAPVSVSAAPAVTTPPSPSMSAAPAPLAADEPAPVADGDTGTQDDDDSAPSSGTAEGEPAESVADEADSSPLASDEADANDAPTEVWSGIPLRPRPAAPATPAAVEAATVLGPAIRRRTTGRSPRTTPSAAFAPPASAAIENSAAVGAANLGFDTPTPDLTSGFDDPVAADVAAPVEQRGTAATDDAESALAGAAAWNAAVARATGAPMTPPPTPGETSDVRADAGESVTHLGNAFGGHDPGREVRRTTGMSQPADMVTMGKLAADLTASGHSANGRVGKAAAPLTSPPAAVRQAIGTALPLARHPLSTNGTRPESVAPSEGSTQVATPAPAGVTSHASTAARSATRGNPAIRTAKPTDMTDVLPGDGPEAHEDLDRLARALYGRMRSRLEADLLVGRERAQMLTDL